MYKRALEVDNFPIYTSTKEIRKLLKMKSNDEMLTSDDFAQTPFRIILKGVSPTETSVSLTVKGGEDEIYEARAYVRSTLTAYLFPKLDSAMLARIDNLLKLVPRSEFLAGMKAIVLSMKPLKSGQISAIEEMEARAANPNESDVALLKKLVSENPGNEFLESVLGQVLGGYELSERQRAAIDRFLPKQDPLLEARIQTLMEKAKSTFLKSVLDQLKAGRALSPKQIAAVEKIERESQEGATTPQQDALVARVKGLVDAVPGNEFLESVLSQAMSGRPLSQRQQDALGRFESRVPSTPVAPPSAPVAPKSRRRSPQEALLTDLILNANLPAREDSIMSGLLNKVVAKTPLDEDEKKAIRHLLYKKQARLRGSYGEDFKGYVREVFA
jgi:hypothetical protein